MSLKPEEAATASADAVPTAAEKQPEDPLIGEKKPEPELEKTESAAPAPTQALENLKLSEEEKPEDGVAETKAAAAELVAPASNAPVWPETPADHPLTVLYSSVEELTKEAGHNEVYGITLSKTNEFHTKLILQKFLRANQGDLVKAKQQLLETLKWRKEFDPVKAAGETFEKSRFEGLGYILKVEGVPESKNKTDVVTFNIYGAVKDNKATFGDLER